MEVGFLIGMSWGEPELQRRRQILRGSPVAVSRSRVSCLNASWSSPVNGRQAGRTDVKIWQTSRTSYKVGDFISWQREGTLSLSPMFQRRPVWKPGAKSYLIDTIMRGLPIPILFLRDLPTDLKTYKSKREVVDGQQRLRTLISYIAPETLSDLDPNRDVFRIKAAHNPDFANRAFKDLPDEVRQHILDYQFSVHVFPSDTDDREILQIFSRMNATGMKLNPQELRNAEYFGEFKTLVMTLATEQLERWQGWGIFKPDNIARMDEVELTSELMIVIMTGIANKTERVISAPYREFEETFAAKKTVAMRFRTVFEAIDNQLQQEVKTLFWKKTLFYALFAGVYDLLFGLQSPLDKTKPEGLTDEQVAHIRLAGETIRNHSAPGKVIEATTRRTTNSGERKTLAKYIAGQQS